MTTPSRGSLFTDPEFAHVGLTEGERAKARAARDPGPALALAENDCAQTERRAPHGHIKGRDSNAKGAYFGATIVGAQAGELIATWTLAIAQGLNIRAFTGIVLPYPTLSEIGKRAAIDFFTPSLTSPWVRRIITWLRIFG